MAELDGSIWVTNYGDGTLTRIGPMTNAASDPVPIGLQPCGITASDGALWVDVLGSDEVVRFDPATNAVTDHVNVNGKPWDVQSGFGSVWVAVQGTDKVLRINPKTAAVVASFDAGSVVVGLAVTSSEVWVANSASETITRIDPKNNTISGEIQMPAGPYWFAVGPLTVLVTLTSDGEATLIDQATAKIITTVTVGAIPRDPGFVGDNYWVANQGTEDVYVIDPTDGTILGTFAPPDKTGIWTAEGLLGDGWIESFAGTAVSRLDAETGLP